jgi:hypothetical protein
MASLVTALYLTDDGQSVVTHSMIKSARDCMNMTKYKYAERLKPKSEQGPLKRGKWIHALLEVHYTGGNWRDEHKKWVKEYKALFEEEQEKLGPLPEMIEQIMRGYFWHYKNDEDWIVHETEFTVEAEFPDGTLYRGRVDNLVETRYGLYLVDHKSHNYLPGSTHRLLDAQSVLYIWAARKMKIPVKGFIWNYIRAKPQSKWRFKQNGELYANIGETDFPTAVASLKAAGKNYKDPQWRERLLALQKMRYQKDAMQLSPFFRRETLEKDNALIKEILSSAIRTANTLNTYDFAAPGVERNPGRRCEWGCSYTNLCTTELLGGNADMVRKREFKIGDPMDYYVDRKDEKEE